MLEAPAAVYRTPWALTPAPFSQVTGFAGDAANKINARKDCRLVQWNWLILNGKSPPPQHCGRHRPTALLQSASAPLRVPRVAMELCSDYMETGGEAQYVMSV